MPANSPAETLTGDEASRLADFARACKAAARVVALYPATHPVIQTALARVADTAERLRAGGAAGLTVLPDGMLLEGRAAAKPDGAITELASFLHAHLIGELRLVGPLAPEAWHTLLGLLARPPEDVRLAGGIGKAWAAAGGGPVEIREIDYGEVLRERPGGLDAGWERIVANYLEGELSDLDDPTLGALLEIAGDTHRFREFTERMVSSAGEGGRRGQKEVVLRVLQALADFVASRHPEQLDRVLSQIAGVVPRLTPELVVRLITTGGAGPDRPAAVNLPGEVRSRLSDATVAEFIARSVSRDQGATARLAQAFQTLVPDQQERARLLDMAEGEARDLPIGRRDDFPDLWQTASELLTSYSDAQYVSEDYGRELTAAQTQALEVERVSDDPPERLRGWLSTVTDGAVRQLNHQVLLDLLAIESRPEAWQQVLDSALAAIDQLVLAGHFELAQQMLDAVTAAARDDQPFADAARAGLDRLRGGPLMRHVVLYIRESDAEVQAVAAFCRTLGPTVIGPLAEALANEQGGAVKRLREVLLAFGAAGRAYVDELRSSANPAVRRTAIELLRAFGGAEALPDLAALLDDAEPAVQREALRAIVQIGTDEAYGTLQQALTSTNPRTRDVIMQVLSASRDERAAPLFVYILEHSVENAELEAVRLSAIEALGKLRGDAESVAALARALYRGEWWAPFRTARYRTAAARALRSCGSAEAMRVLEQAADDGSAGVRRAARAALTQSSAAASGGRRTR